MSKSENKIEQIFKQEGIECIREKSFCDLKKGQLRYDFYLPKLHTLIEYDSELHFFKVPHFHHKYNDFSHAQENDRIKNSYALSHSIPLFRIPYWAFNSLKTSKDILKDEFRVTSRWHNDIIYREHLKGGENNQWKILI